MNVGEPPAWPRRVAVVGAGRMGGGIAEAFAAPGLDVRVTDATPDLARQARERVIARTRGHIDAGLLPEEALERAERVEAADGPPAAGAGPRPPQEARKRAERVGAAAGPAEAVDGADLVLEAVAEDTGVKLEVHAAIEAAAPADAVIATNTSSLDVDRLKEAIERRERFLGMH